MDRPNQPGGNETGSDRLFEESWRAAQAGLRKRAQRLARGNSHRRSRLSADFFAGDVSQDRRSRVHS